MSNPNLVTVFSPAGEPFEMSRANARDLTTHAGWSYQPKADSIAAVTVPPAAEEKVEETKDATDDATSEGSGEAAEEAAEGESIAEEETPGTEEEATEVTPEEPTEVTPEEPTEVTPEDFDNLETREDVVAYLAANFPDFKPHHKSSRAGLVEKLVGLINA